MWNSIRISSPPINTFKAKCSNIDLTAVISILENGLKTLNKSLEILKAEVALLCKTIYQMKLRFRCDKGFNYVEKTTKLLRKAFEFNIGNDLVQFLDMMPRKYGKSMYLPTRQMLEYLLVRIQGFARFLCRIIISAQIAGQFMNNRLCLGHFWMQASLWLASMARITQLSKFLVRKCCCDWFNDLRPLLQILEGNDMEWLPSDYVLPIDLVGWLQVDWINDEAVDVSDYSSRLEQVQIPIFNLLENSDDEDDDDVKFCYQYKLNDCYVIEDEDEGDCDIIQTIPGNKVLVNQSVISIPEDDEDKIETIPGNKVNPSIISITDDDEVQEQNVSKVIISDLEDIGETVSRQNLNLKNKGIQFKSKKKKLKNKSKRKLEMLLNDNRYVKFIENLNKPKKKKKKKRYFD